MSVQLHTESAIIFLWKTIFFYVFITSNVHHIEIFWSFLCNDISYIVCAHISNPATY